MLFKVIGAILIAFGATDFAMSTFMQTDIWSQWLGIDLYSMSEIVWQYIAWAFIVLGFVIWSMGGKEETASE